MNEAKVFYNQHTPYRGKYCIQSQKPDMFGNRWHTEQQPLTYPIIQRAILGEITAAYFQKTITCTLGIDIDDHKGYGKAYLLNLYSQVIDHLGGLRPSVLIESPRGMHLFYYLDQLLPTNLLIRQAQEALKGVPCEVKPTMTASLRIPQENRIISPYTFKRLTDSLEYIVSEAERYSISDLFYSLEKPERDTPKQRKKKLTALKTAEKLEAAEDEIAPGGFIPGESNDQFMALAIKYRTYGLDIEQAYDRFMLILNNSYLYSGELQQKPKRLWQKLSSFYSKELPQPEYIRQPDMFYNEVIEDIIKLSPFAKQRQKPLRRFLTELFYWKSYHDRIKNEDPGRAAELNYLYPYYIKARKEGYYPLPSSLLRQWNIQYDTIISFLLSLGILEASPYNYSTVLHTCKHYKIADSIPSI